MAEFSFEVVGEVVAGANTVTITVADPPAPVEYVATGITSCDINAESALALALRARTRRLTHEDQISRPGRAADEGFKHADRTGKEEFAFFTKAFQLRAAKVPSHQSFS